MGLLDLFKRTASGQTTPLSTTQVDSNWQKIMDLFPTPAAGTTDVGKVPALKADKTGFNYAPVISSIIPGANISIDVTDPNNPVISAISNAMQSSKYLIAGGSVWSGTGLTYDVTAINYYFNGNKTADATQITLSASDPTNDRVDAIVVDESGVISIIEGVAASPALVPPIPLDQLLIQYVVVKATTTEPVIVEEAVYLDNDEWTTSTFNLPGTAIIGSTDFEATGVPKQGTKFISNVGRNQNTVLRFAHAGALNINDFTTASFWVRLPQTLPNGCNIVAGLSMDGLQYSGIVPLSLFGLKNNITNAWQLVVIPMSILTLTVFNQLVIGVIGNTSGINYDIDAIKLSNGSISAINEQVFNVLKDGALVGQSSSLNFKGGAVNVTKDVIGGKIDVEVIGSGGSPAGSDTQIQYNNAGAFGASGDLLFDYTSKVFQAGDVTETTNHNWIKIDDDKQEIIINGTGGGSISTTTPVFTGPGLNNLNLSGSYSGSGPYPTDYVITITDTNIPGTDVLGMPTGGYVVGELITGLSSGATGTVVASTEYNSRLYLSGTTVTFSNGESISGSISGTVGSINDPSPFGSSSDLYELLVTPYLSTPTTYILATAYGANVDGFYVDFFSSTGHTVGNTWTWQVIDSTVYGNSLYIDTSTQGKPIYKFGDVDEVATKDRIFIDTDKDGFQNFASSLWNVKDVLDNTFIKIDIDNKEYSIGDVDYSNNGTKITIDDVNEQITISNLPAYDDDAAAGVGGLTAGMVYMTTGSGSAPLNVAGILMIKQ